MLVMRRLRDGDSGSALITALISTMIMLALGLALLAIVDTQASESGDERTRDRGFNLSESVLTSEAFVLGRSWPSAAPSPDPASCSVGGAGFTDTLGATTTPSVATARLRPNLNASYTDAAYAGATWQVNICDDVSGSTVWSDTLLSNKSWDFNANDRVWVRAQSIVGGKTRVVVGLVQVRKPAALNPKYGLVAGNIKNDLGTTLSAITNATVVSSVTSGLLNTYPPVAVDAAYPAPASGVTGLRCGLLDQIGELKTCITGMLGALSSIPLFDSLLGSRYEQFPSTSSTSPDAIGQLRSQAKTSPGVYMATTPGGATAATTQSCNIPAAANDQVVFIEQVGTGDQYCVVDVTASKSYKALIIGSGRVVIRGNNSITPYSTVATNRFTGVVYALNLQTADHSAFTPTKELVVVEKGARVRGAVHADGKNAIVSLVAPDFSTNSLVDALLCPGLLCITAKLLPLNELVGLLINGTCLVPGLFGSCLISLPGNINGLIGNLTSQFSSYGSAIRSDVGIINALKVYGASGVLPGTFRDLQTQ